MFRPEAVVRLSQCTLYGELLFFRLLTQTVRRVASAVNSWKDAVALKVAESTIDLSDNIKSLGVIFDSCQSLDEHVKNVCNACYFDIGTLRHVRSCISTDTANVVFMLDYDDDHARLLQRLVGRCIGVEPVQTTARTEYIGACCHRNPFDEIILLR